MKIGMASTYPPMRCGIGIYAQKLLRAMAEEHPHTDIYVIGEHGTEDDSHPGVSASAVYSRHGNYADDILRQAQALNLDLLHFQHAPDLFGADDRLPELLRRLKQAGIRTAVTLHTVHEEKPLHKVASRWSPVPFHRALGLWADTIVVHHKQGMADMLIAQGIDAKKIAVIPHGTSLMTLGDVTESRRHLGLPEDAVVLTFFGFIHIQKNVHTAAEAFIRAAQNNPKAVLYITGMPFENRWYNRLYIQALRTRARLKGMSDRIIIEDAYIPPENVAHVYTASDILLLPHWQRYGSASGVFHQSIGAGKPVLCAKGPKFEDGLKQLASHPELMPAPLSISQWTTAIDMLLRDEALREQVTRLFSAYAHDSTWAKVARKHHQVYEKSVKG